MGQLAKIHQHRWKERLKISKVTKLKANEDMHPQNQVCMVCVCVWGGGGGEGEEASLSMHFDAFLFSSKTPCITSNQFSFSKAPFRTFTTTDMLFICLFVREHLSPIKISCFFFFFFFGGFIFIC